MRKSALHLGVLLFLTPALAFAESGKPLPITVEDEIHKAAVKTFINECVDGDGYLRSGPGKEWCAAEKTQLDRNQKRLESLATSIESKSSFQCTLEAETKLDAEMEKIVAAMLDKHLNTCDESKESDAKACIEQLTCQSLKAVQKRSSRSPLDFAIAQSVQGLKIDRACPKEKGQSSECGEAIVVGMLKSVWLTGKGIFYDLPKFIFGKSEEKKLAEFDQVNSNGLAQASAMSDTDVSDWKKNPAAFMKTFFAALFTSIEEASRKTFGCARWSGVPYASDCLQSMKSWSCSTCAQKSQVICGIGGFMGGEIVTSYAIGGLFFGGEKAFKAGSAAAVAGGEKLVQLSNEVPVLGQVFSQSRELGLALYGATSGVRRVTVASIHSTGTALKAIKGGLPQSTEFSKALSGVVFYPISKYFGLMDSAMKLGYTHGDRLLASVGTAGKAKFYVGLPRIKSTDTEIKLDAEMAKRFDALEPGIIPTSDPNVKIRFDRANNVLVILRSAPTR